MVKFRFSKGDFETALCIGELKKVFDRVTDTANEILESHLDDADINGLEEWERLRIASLKLGSLACLIEHQQSTSEKVDYGLGLLLAGISHEIRQSSRRLERESTKKIED